ncbi:hypothetical protein [Methanobrevibacter filiformis]|uniref:Uncharacterized protein n=1 Tax=Methanobrevibacter filiformis TaxID=55758 RepID=A0A166ENA7_9EURY|nr:hypothetical protein [Methanobrevibacter filiformis]KZX16838.1 hypothetical protein MBFIL_04680 [Methanobrevibacter filiformis]
MIFYYNLPFGEKIEKGRSIGHIAAVEALNKFQEKAIESLKKADI